MHLPSASPPCLRHTQPLAQDWAQHKGSENLSHFTNIYCVVVLHQPPSWGLQRGTRPACTPQEAPCPGAMTDSLSTLKRSALVCLVTLKPYDRYPREFLVDWGQG